MSFGAPHRHFRRHRLDQHPRPRAGRGRAPRTAPSSPPTSRPPAAAARAAPGPRPPGKALLYSAIVRPLDERHLLLPLAVPLAVCEAAEELRPGIECSVKWPNDVWLDGRKLAGILIEARPQDGWAVIGVGLNLTIAPRRVPARPPRHGDLALRLRRGVGGVPTEPPRCCSGGTPPTPATQPKS